MKLSVWGWLNRVRSRNNLVFDDHAAIVVQRAVRLRHELALDWPGIAVALTLMDDIAHLKQENRLLRQRTFPVCSSSVMCVCRMR